MRHAVSAIVLKARTGEPLSLTEIEALCGAVQSSVKGQRPRLLMAYHKTYYPHLSGRPAGRQISQDVDRYYATVWRKHQHHGSPPDGTPAQQVALFYICKAGLPLKYETIRKWFT